MGDANSQATAPGLSHAGTAVRGMMAVWYASTQPCKLTERCHPVKAQHTTPCAGTHMGSDDKERAFHSHAALSGLAAHLPALSTKLLHRADGSHTAQLMLLY